ncbi:hypothetical protein BZG09_13875 [Salinivibrio kushneri]|uniref:Uncharacterized protein n=1 Tax=Salinivibrio kushneri TaxID=1908198 RepID=A0AB36K3C5_9GAMM|nr:hypothetical protein BZG09_13875 [Salinivibrio kushneri]OOE52409.1 hypothetical protein BZG12_10855 [Salinivibrio kushneri]
MDDDKRVGYKFRHESLLGNLLLGGGSLVQDKIIIIEEDRAESPAHICPKAILMAQGTVWRSRSRFTNIGVRLYVSQNTKAYSQAASMRALARGWSQHSLSGIHLNQYDT